MLTFTEISTSESHKSLNLWTILDYNMQNLSWSIKISNMVELRLSVKYRVSKKKPKRKMFNEPLNSNDIFKFQNLIRFCLSTP